MSSFTVEGLELAAAQMRARMAKARNFQPVLKRIGADIVKETDDGFQNSKSPKGEAFPPLKESTILGRSGVRKRAKRSKKFRAQLLAPGGAKPLVDTARARNSQFAKAGPKGVTWSAVGYLLPHMVGNARGRPPKRNPTVFELGPTGWKLVPRLSRKYSRMIIRHIEGKR